MISAPPCPATSGMRGESCASRNGTNEAVQGLGGAWSCCGHTQRNRGKERGKHAEHTESYWLKPGPSRHMQGPRSVLHPVLIILQASWGYAAQIWALTWMQSLNCEHQGNFVTIFFFFIACFIFLFFFFSFLFCFLFVLLFVLLASALLSFRVFFS